VTGFVGIALLILTQVNFLGDLLLTRLKSEIAKEFNVELVISPLEGNPVMGFRGSDVVLLRSGDELLSADKVEIKLSMASLIKNSPRVSVLVIDGLKSDYNSLNSLVPKKKDASAKDIPVDKVEFLNTCISSKWGLLKLDRSFLEIRGSQWLAPVFKGTVADIPFSVSGIIKKDRGSWILDGFTVDLDKGTAKLSGVMSPSLNLNVEMKEMNLSKMASLVPALKKTNIRGMLSGTCYMKGIGRDMEMLGEGNLKDALLLGIPLSQVIAKWNYGKNFVEVDMTQGDFFKSSLTGHIKLDNRPGGRYLEIKAKANDLQFADWTGKFTEEMPKDVMYLQGGIKSLTADIKGPVDALRGKIDVAESDLSYKNIKFSGLHGAVVFDGKPEGSVNFSALHNGKNITLAGKCGFAKNVKTKLDFKADSIKIETLEDSFNSLKKYKLKGAASVQATIEGLSGRWLLDARVLSPQLKIEKIGTVNNMDALSEYIFTSREFLIKKMSCVWNGAKITASGGTKPAVNNTGLSFRGTFKNMAAEKFYSTLPFLDKMNISANAYGTWILSGTAKSPKILLNAASSKGRFKKLKIDKFTTKMTYSSGVLNFDPMNVSAADGIGILRCSVVLPKTRAGYDVKTKAEWEVSGRIKGVDVSALNGLLTLSQDINGPCNGDIKIGNKGNGLQWSANLAGSNLRWQRFCADEAKGFISGDAEKIRINGIKVSFLRGEHDITGTVLFAGSGKPVSDTRLDLKITSKKINMYELIRKHLPVIRGVQGLIRSTVSVEGTLGRPLYHGTGTFAPFRYRGFLLPMVDIDFNGGLSEINITKANARMHSGSISGRGRVYKQDGEWHANLRTEGSDIDMNQLGAYLPKKFRAGLGGKSSFKLKGSGKVSNFRGEGDFSSDEMKFLGIELKKVNAPFYISGGYAVMEDVKADTNGGTLTGGLAMDLNKSIWGGNLTVLSADVQPMMKQLFPELKGTISGKGDLKVRAGGETGRMSTVKGAGVLLMHNGEIKGFNAVEAARKYTKGKPLLFKSIQSAFAYDGGDLTILPGSQAIAPTGDPVYRYVMVDGLINKDNELSMFAMGKVNIQALNAFLGALQGIINVGIDSQGEIDKNELLKNFLGGVLSGFTRTDFRFVTMNVNGTIKSPVFSNVKVDKSEQIGQGKDVIPHSASDPKDKDFTDGDTTFRLKFEIPVGPGDSKTPNNVEGQVLEQTLGNVLQYLNLGH
jgi:hypothetical protein